MIADWITDYTDLRITQIKGFADFAVKLIGNQNKSRITRIADFTDFADFGSQIKGFADFADKLIGNQNKSRITRIADWITDYTDLVIMQI